MDRQELVAQAKKKFEREQLVAAAKSKFQSENAPEEKQLPSGEDTGRAALEGAGEFLTAGYFPQIKAGIAQLISAPTLGGVSPEQALATIDSPIRDVFSGKAYENLPKGSGYVELRDKAIAGREATKAKDPLGYGLGMGAGIAATAGLGGAQEAIKKGFIEAAKRVGESALVGAGTAAAFNPGDVEGVVDPIQAEERGKAALFGGGLSGAGAGISELAHGLAPKLQEGAQALAARSLGRGTKGFKEKLGEKGMLEIGQKALDEGIVSAVPKTIKGINESVSKARDSVGKQIGKVIDDTAEIEQKLMASGAQVGIDKKSIADKVRADLIDPDLFPSPEYVEKVERRIESFLKTGADPKFIETKGANIIRQKLGADMERKGAWKRIKMGTPSEDDILSLTFYDNLSDAVVGSTNALAEAAPGVAPKNIQSLNKEYSQLKNMQKLTKDEMARTGTNRMLDLTSVIAGTGVGVGSQDPTKGAATALGLMALRRGGPQVGAKLLQGVSKLASKVPQISPVAAGLTAGELVQRAEASKFPPKPTAGAKVLDVIEYKNSQDMVDISPMDQEMVQKQVMDSDLSNTEKAAIATQLMKGKISRKVIEYLSGPKDQGNLDAQSVLGQ